MAVTISLTEDQAFAAVRTFLIDVLPANTPVVQGLDNRVPQPSSNLYCYLTAYTRVQLSTTTHDYDDEPSAGTETIARQTDVTIQIDLYGEQSPDYVQVLTTLLRDEYGCTALKASGVQPLYCTDPMPMPLVNGEEQYERRWMTQLHLQGNLAVSTPMEFADKLEVTLQEVD